MGRGLLRWGQQENHIPFPVVCPLGHQVSLMARVPPGKREELWGVMAASTARDWGEEHAVAT